MDLMCTQFEPQPSTLKHYPQVLAAMRQLVDTVVGKLGDRDSAYAPPTHNLISQKVFFLHKSIPAQIRERIIYISNNQGYVDRFVRKLTFAKRLNKHFL